MSHDQKDDSFPSSHHSVGTSSSTSKPTKSKSATSQHNHHQDAPNSEYSQLKRNAKGGIYVSPHELHQAFEFFDIDNKGFINISDLKKRLGVFYQNLSLREYKFLLNNKQELTEQELYALLANNELTNYDPVAEAFKIYDPNETGYIDLEVFREILSNLGFGDITDQDIQTLIDTADVRSINGTMESGAIGWHILHYLWFVIFIHFLLSLYVSIPPSPPLALFPSSG